MHTKTKHAILKVGKQCVSMIKNGSTADRLSKQLLQYQLGVFRVVIIGEINKGKSTFINALLNSNVMPTSDVVTNSIIFKVMYGPEPKAKVFMKPHLTSSEADSSTPTRQVDIKEIPLHEIAEYGTESKNPGNIKNVDFIGVQVPNPALKEGLALIDTPGLGGMFKSHNEVTWKYLPSADAVFFITDSVEAVISADEIETLKQVQEITPYIFFIQTKIDLKSDSDCEQWKQRNIEILTEGLGVDDDHIQYFPVSSTLKLESAATNDRELLDASEFVPLVSFIENKLLPNKEHRLQNQFLTQLRAAITAEKNELQVTLEILGADDEQLSELQENYKQQRIQLDEWSSGKYRDVRNSVGIEIDKIFRIGRNRQNLEIDDSKNGPIIKPIIDDLKSLERGVEYLQKHVHQLVQQCSDHCSKIACDIKRQQMNALENVVKSHLSGLMDHDLLEDIDINIGVPNTAVIESVPTSSLAKIRTTFFGYSAITMITGTILGAISLPLAAPIAATAGLIGALHSFRETNAKDLEKIMRELQGLLNAQVRDANKQIGIQLENSAVTNKTNIFQAIDGFQACLIERADEIKTLIDERRADPQVDRTLDAKSVVSKIEEFTAIHKQLDRFLSGDA